MASSLVGPLGYVIQTTGNYLVKRFFGPDENTAPPVIPADEQVNQLKPKYRVLYDQIVNDLTEVTKTKGSIFYKGPVCTADKSDLSKTVIIFRRYSEKTSRSILKENREKLHTLAKAANKEARNLSFVDAVNDNNYCLKMKFLGHHQDAFKLVLDETTQENAIQKIGEIGIEIANSVSEKAPFVEWRKDWLDRIDAIQTCYKWIVQAKKQLQDPLFVQVCENHPFLYDELTKRVWHVTEKKVLVQESPYSTTPIELGVREYVDPNLTPKDTDKRFLTMDEEIAEEHMMEKIVNLALTYVNNSLKTEADMHISNNVHSKILSVTD